jgi:hypothetical protein
MSQVQLIDLPHQVQIVRRPRLRPVIVRRARQPEQLALPRRRDPRMVGFDHLPPISR